MPKVKIIQLVEGLEIGGRENVISSIVQGLDKSVYYSEVWCLDHGGALADELSSMGFVVRVIGISSYYNPIVVIKLALLLKAAKPDILHIHGYFAGTPGRIAAKMAGIKTVFYHVHSTHFGYRWRNLGIEKLLSGITTKIICCSYAVRKFVIEMEKIAPGKTVVVYNGVTPADTLVPSARGMVRKKYGIGAQSKVVATIASLTPQKGHQVLFNAVPKVLEKFNDAVFLIVGQGPLLPELERLAKILGIHRNIVFTGIRRDVFMLLSDVDLVVLPSSKREGLGIALLEAMAAAKPVVGSTIGGIPEVIVDNVNGLLVPPNDPDSLAKAITEILSDEQKAVRFGKAGYLRLKEIFSLDKMMADILKLYEGELEIHNTHSSDEAMKKQTVKAKIDVKAIKEKERKFRESEIPFGEHAARARGGLGNLVELGNVLKSIKPLKRNSVLDIGCADGRFLEFLRTRFPSCTLSGTDFAVNPIKGLKSKNFKSYPACADISDIPFKSDCFDRAVCIQVLHHVPSRKERLKVLQEIYRIMAPHSRFVVTVLNQRTWHDAVENGKEGSLSSDLTVYLYNARELQVDLAKAGFRVEYVRGICNLPGRVLKNLGFSGVWIDFLITRFFPQLSLINGSYLLASCVKEKKTVLQLIPNIAPGGAERMVLSLQLALDKNKFDCKIIVWEQHQELLREKKFKDAAVIHAALPHVISLASVIAIVRIIRKTRADIVQTHLIDADILGFFAAKLTGISHIATIHSYPFPAYRRHFLRYRLMTLFSSRIIFVSETVKKHVLLNSGIAAKKVHVIHNGIDLDKFSMDNSEQTRTYIRRELGITNDAFVVGNVSRLIPDKGHIFLIRAIPLVLQSCPEAVFAIVGDGKLRQSLEKEAESLGVSANVIFAGARHDIPDVLSAMDLFVFPTFNEAFGLCILEAMAMGIPVIATNDAGACELIENDTEGLLINPGDPQAIAEAVKSLLGDKEKRASLAVAALRKVSDFSLENSVKKYESLYGTLPSKKVT